jgi:hypothetical protein
MTENPEDHEESARKLVQWTEDFFDWVWDKGALGKIALLLWFLTILAPPIFNGYAIYVLWFTLYPTATTLTERLAVLGFLIALANAEALWLQYVLFQSMFSAYVNRRKRRRKNAQALS